MRTRPGEIDRQFTVLRQAVEGKRAIQCRYYTIGRDVEDKRTIEPYGLMLSWATGIALAAPATATLCASSAWTA